MKNVLIILTNHATLGTTDEANGTYSPELTHALHTFLEAGYRYDLVSIKGGNAPVYGVDMEDDQVNSEVFTAQDLANKLANTKKPVTLIQMTTTLYSILVDLACYLI
tara:strand:- start:1253 stop:1573 length:321 start_codon:yes stop_codon:yes gene_type:complete